jgi:hypothetical protein
MDSTLRKNILKVGKAKGVVENVTQRHSLPSTPAASMTSSAIIPPPDDLFSIDGSQLSKDSSTSSSSSSSRKRAAATPPKLASLTAGIGAYISNHQAMAAATTLTDDPIEMSKLQEGMEAVKEIYATVIKADNAAKDKANGRKKPPKTYSPKFVYVLVPFLPNGEPAEEFKVGRTNASFDELLEFCKDFNLRYGTYITHYFVELFEVKDEVTTAQIEKLILRLRNIESPVEQGYYPFKGDISREVSDIKHEELRNYLLGRLDSHPPPQTSGRTYADGLMGQSFTGFAMVLFISTP